MARARRGPSTRTRSKQRSRNRAERPRPTPRWLTGRQDLDEVAQRRCLMVLSVLSGEKPVTTAIQEMNLSRGTYYQLETKAIVAMLAALAPGADGASTPDGASQTRRIAELESQVSRLEQDKRRLERLLYLTRKIVPPGPVTTRGRPRKTAARVSKTSGRRPLPFSLAKTTTRPPGPAPSTPTTDGATTP